MRFPPLLLASLLSAVLLGCGGQVSSPSTALSSELGACVPERGACVGPIAWHLRRSVDMQFLGGRTVDELARCGSSAAEDIAANRLLCDARRGVELLQPRFGLFYGNGWFTMNPASRDACASAADLQSALACIAGRMKPVIDDFHRVAPQLVFSGLLAEYVARSNVTPTQWKSICRPGSSPWGVDACVPDLASSLAAREYLVAWGDAFVDAGIRSLIFGEVRMMTGTPPETNHITGAGAVGLGYVISHIRAHAAAKGINNLSFGLQNAAAATVGGVELADFVEGALHLEVHGNQLLQPLGPRGPFVHGIYSAYDWHDANLANDASSLPVLLDYDNWSGAGQPADDIRNLSEVSPARRARVFKNHFNHLQVYNPHATLSVPLSKQVGDGLRSTCHGVSAYQFAASSCGLLGVAYNAFLMMDTLVPTDVFGSTNPPIEREFWGQQLRGRDETVAWLYLSLLGRRITPAEYAARIEGLPALIDTSGGERLALAAELARSREFAARGLDDTGFVKLAYRTLVLREPDAGGLAYWSGIAGRQGRPQVLAGLAASAEARALYAP